MEQVGTCRRSSSDLGDCNVDFCLLAKILILHVGIRLVIKSYEISYFVSNLFSLLTVSRIFFFSSRMPLEWKLTFCLIIFKIQLSCNDNLLLCHYFIISLVGIDSNWALQL